MLTLDVKGKQGVFILNLPTSLNEINESYIKDVTSDVKIDANYTLIGIIFKEKLSTLILNARKNTNKADVAVIPIFVKAGETDSKFITELNICDKLIISPSDIMMGHHISTPKNMLTINTILDIVNGDPIVFNKSLSIKEECYFIEFKLVPNCNIHGAYDETDIKTFENPFVTKISDTSEQQDSTIISPTKPGIIV